MTLEPNDPPLARNPTTPAAGSAAMRVANLTDYRVRCGPHDRASTIVGKGDYAAPAEDATARLTTTILTAADRCIACRVEMDAFMAHYRARQCPEVGMIHPAFRELVAHFAVPWEELVAAVDEAEHPNAYFHPGSPLTRPLDWRALIADAHLLAALEHGIAREREHVCARAAARSHAERGTHPYLD